ncbi:sensor histidine kinase [Colwellia psychrerythraea]|uniref:histidine kinase n=1 Tax=Colwellia psychrerythraea TaxID=28229 RepID=A0A099KQP6_COLPS|nr:ATP-binding protein [Colwellia psychrerythraea]KGJ92831.1 ATP-binding region ATPase domain protein [Colwellia psychrerythraea]
MAKLYGIKAGSLEQYLNQHLILLMLPLLFLVFLVTWQLSWPWWGIAFSEVLILIYVYRLTSAIKAKTLESFQRASLQLDAIAQEDYKLYARASFSQGQVASFHQQLNELSAELQVKKSRYDQHVFLVYQLIAQLDAPILVFNAKQQLTFANEAFYQLKKQPWQLFRHASPQLIGLTKQEGQWCFKVSDAETNNESECWQIKQSEFIDSGEQHLLLFFVDIQSALRASQLNAWQQIIRVLGHEIRNSLTPVSSMAESLADKASNERDKLALTVITERCMHLQSFVERYASISKQSTLYYQTISVNDFFAPLMALYNTDYKHAFTVQLDSRVETMIGDNSFLSQVFINLLKNAKEAAASQASIQISIQTGLQKNNQQVSRQHNFTEMLLIEVIDDGHGFSNLANLFVPLYSTKEQGQGIGLSFCRNIIEQHQGSISIVNNVSSKASTNTLTSDSTKKVKQGITVAIYLPVKAV